MSTAISPWADTATKESPDGRWVACFDGGMEICQGGPIRGTLKIRRKESDEWLYMLSDASASFVWASDSTAVAVPRWTQKRAHQLIVIRVPTMSLVEMREHYRVLQLDSFDAGLIAGIDSPIHQPESFTATLTSTGELIPTGESKKPWWKLL
jgi:hypothetical protein